MKEVDLTKDGRYKLFTYRFMEDDRQSYTCEDFRPIMIALDKLHQQNYVHSDVRRANMIFPNEGPAKLIDFDLTAKADVPYPPGYNCDLPERHPGIKVGQHRMKAHDRYSLIHIITQYVSLNEVQRVKLTCLKDSSFDLQTVFND